MFELLRKDIKTGDTVKLYLITGKEPEGTVLEIGLDFILIQSENNSVNRFFDKLIGGWEILKKTIEDEKLKTYRLFKVARELEVDVSLIIEKLKSNGTRIEENGNSKISKTDYEFLKTEFPINNDIVPSPELDAFIVEKILSENPAHPLTDSQLWRQYSSKMGIRIPRKNVALARKRLEFQDTENRKIVPVITDTLESTTYQDDPNKKDEFKLLFSSFQDLQGIMNEEQLGQYISPNAEINQYFPHQGFGFARNNEIEDIRFRIEYIFDKEIFDSLKFFKKGDTIPILCFYYTAKNGKTHCACIVKPNYVANIISTIKSLLAENQANAASKLLTILKKNKITLTVIDELKHDIDHLLKEGQFNKPINPPDDLNVTKIDINNLSSVYENARKLRLRKQFDDSEKLFVEIINKKFQIDTAVKDLADQYREQGRLTEAINLVQRHFDDFEKKDQAYNFLYDLYVSNEELEKAKILLEHYVQTPFDINNRIQKNRRGKSYARLGALSLKINETENAKKYFQKAEELYPNNKLSKSASRLFLRDKDDVTKHEEYFNENLFDTLVYGISPFLKYALENCTYEGLPILVKENKIFNKKTLNELRGFIEKTKGGRPEVRAKYYLTEAKILQDIESTDDVDFNKALSKYCNAMAKVIASERGPLETVREYYLNAFNIEDEWRPIARQVSLYFETFYKTNRELVASSGVGIEHAIREINAQIYSNDSFWNYILELIINSKQATARILSLLFNIVPLKEFSVTFIERYFNLHIEKQDINETKYIELWKEASKQRKTEKEQVDSEFKSYLRLNNIQELISTFFGKGKNSLPPFFNELDKARVNALNSICDHTDQYIHQDRFDDKEFYLNNIESKYAELVDNINIYPTGFSISSILPFAAHLLNLLKQKHAEVIIASKPLIDVQIEGENIIDDEKRCEIQVSMANQSHCSKVGEIQIAIVEMNKNIVGVKTSESFNQNLRGGGEPLIAKFILNLNDDILKQGATDIKIAYTYKELATNEDITEEKDLSISLYDSSEFVEIANPYAEHAKSNIVENPQMFKGRDELIKRICGTILTAKSKGYVIYGQKRSGKSSILWHLENNLNKLDNAFAIYFSTGLSIAQDNDIEANLYYTILTSIERKIRKAKANGIVVPEVGRTNREELLSSPSLVFYDRLNNIKEAFLIHDNWKSRKLVLIVDEFTYLYYQILKGNISSSFMLNWKAFVEDGGFSVILSGQDSMTKFIEEFQNEFAMFKTERLTYLEPEAARELIEEPIWDGIKNRSRYTRNSVEKIIDLTACSPFYIQIVCNELVRYMNAKRKPVLTPADVDDVIEMLTLGFNSLTEFDFENLLSAGDKNLDEIKPSEAKVILKEIANQTKFLKYCKREEINAFGQEKDDIIINDLLKRSVISEEPQHPNKFKIQVQLFKQWLLNHN